MFPVHDDNPVGRIPFLTVGLIAACVLAFLWQRSLGDQGPIAAYALGVIPAVLFEHKVLPDELIVVPPWATVFTSMFLHGGWMHLLGNMLYLWVFGKNVEDAMGHIRFLLFYLACGVVAVLAQALPEPDSTIPMIGASGAISGLLGAYLLLYPHARVLVVLPIGFYLHTMRIAAYWVLGLWFGMQVVSTLLTDSSEGGVAFGAHIGGFLAGMVLVALFKRRDVRLFAPLRSANRGRATAPR